MADVVAAQLADAVLAVGDLSGRPLAGLEVCPSPQWAASKSRRCPAGMRKGVAQRPGGVLAGQYVRMVSYPPREPGPRRFTAPTPADGPTVQLPRFRSAPPAGFAGDDGPTAPHQTFPRPTPPAHPAATPPPLVQPPTQPLIPHPPAAAIPPAAPAKRKGRRAVVVLGLIVAVVVAGLVGADVFLRNRAESVVADTVKCSTGDTSTVAFAAMPPLLWQYATGMYSSIRIQTSGNRIRDMRGMAVVIDLRDVRPPADTAAGSVGSADASLTWSLDGIKETVRKAVPVGGTLLTDVTASPSDGTIKLGNFLVSVTVKPKKLDNGNIALDVVNTEGPGLSAITTLQPALDAYLAKQKLPLNLRADQLSVTDHGVNAHLTSSNVNLPAESEKDCYPTN